MINRNDALETSEWRNLPMEKQMGFELPIEIMLDLPHMRKKHNVMTMSEYFHLQGLNSTRERSNGHWDRTYYHEGVDQPSLFVIPNNIYDPESVVRVDVMPPRPSGPSESDSNPILGSTTWTPTDVFGHKINAKLIVSTIGKNRAHLEWAEAMDALKDNIDINNNTSVDNALRAAGWFVLYTWDGA